jgi:hypothetical protein
MPSDVDEPNPFAPPATEIRGDAPGAALPPGGMPFGGILVLLFAGSFAIMWIFWALFWSAWMSYFEGWDFWTTLLFRGLPGGFMVAILFSTMITIYLGVFMKRTTMVIDLAGSRAEIAGRIEGAVAKLRYRLTHRSESMLVYARRALFHVAYYDLIIRVDEGTATLTGPKAVLTILRKKLQ